MQIETLLLGVLSMIVLALGVIFFVILYQRRIIAHQQELKEINEQKETELIQAAIQSEEDERNRIATELHDDVAATLASARLFLYKGKDVPFDDEKISQSKELLDESIKKIRAISHKLQPSLLQHLGLQSALQSLIETLNNSGNIDAKFTAKNTVPRISDNIELSAYRISQELIANILKHTQAARISIATDVIETSIVILFTHDGIGMTHELYQEQIYKKGSTGLKNIVNRLKSINGSISYYVGDEGLYKTELKIPFTN